jgi:hypothetical protein
MKAFSGIQLFREKRENGRFPSIILYRVRMLYMPNHPTFSSTRTFPGFGGLLVLKLGQSLMVKRKGDMALALYDKTQNLQLMGYV